MPKTSTATLVCNYDEGSHGSKIIELLSQSTHFEFAVAFVKMSGIGLIEDAIVSRLKEGMTARFVIGLDFYQTDPDVLKRMLSWTKSYRIKAYISPVKSSYCFHPKMYVFQTPKRAFAIIGSSNVTSGGFTENWEASFILESADQSDAVDHITALIESDDVVPLTRKRYVEYSRQHAIAKALQLANKREVSRLTQPGVNTFEVLARVVSTLRKDPVENLDQRSASRAENTKRARKLLNAFTPTMADDTASLLKFLRSIRPFFHASIIQLHSPTISKSPVEFVKLMASMKEAISAGSSAAVCWDRISPIMAKTKGLGPNWVSEILHAFDPSKFAVINRASVSGMALAGLKFPKPPTKTRVTSKVYGEFCLQAVKISKSLGLRNTSELDAVFGYAYFEKGEEYLEYDDE
jgi:HKD family nuclease